MGTGRNVTLVYLHFALPVLSLALAPVLGRPTSLAVLLQRPTRAHAMAAPPPRLLVLLVARLRVAKPPPLEAEADEGTFRKALVIPGTGSYRRRFTKVGKKKKENHKVGAMGGLAPAW